MAASVLTCAAKVVFLMLLSLPVTRTKTDGIMQQYEEMLRLADDIGGTHKQAKARASIIYFSSRMEAVRWFSPDDDPLSPVGMKPPPLYPSHDEPVWANRLGGRAILGCQNSCWSR
jgi:hypothetical protein